MSNFSSVFVFFCYHNNEKRKLEKYLSLFSMWWNFSYLVINLTKLLNHFISRDCTSQNSPIAIMAPPVNLCNICRSQQELPLLSDSLSITTTCDNCSAQLYFCSSTLKIVCRFFTESQGLTPKQATLVRTNSLLRGRNLEQDPAHMGDPCADGGLSKEEEEIKEGEGERRRE